MNVFSRDRLTHEGGLRVRIAGLPPWARWGASAVAVVALIFLGWLVFEAVGAKSSLEHARDNAQQAKEALLAGKSEDATQWAEKAQSNAQHAQAATHSLPWNLAAAVPLLGTPLKTSQQMSDVVVDLAGDVLLPATKMGAAVSPDRLIEGTRLNLSLLRDEQSQLSELSAAAARIDSEAQEISAPSYLSVIHDARSKLQEQTSRLAQLLANASLAAKLAPSMLGADGPRTYLMGFQTPAEARGTGGILGGFGILRFDDGRPIIESLGSNSLLKEARTTVDLGPEFDQLYGWTNPYTDFRNTNLSPHFPYAAQIWRSMWQGESGMLTDGVIAMDPVALSYILGAIGPVTLPDGEIIDANNVIELTMSTAYVRFPQDPKSKDVNARKQYLLSIASAVAAKMTENPPAPRKLLDAFGKAVSERRISVWSANPADQSLLETTPLAHTVPEGPAPYAEVVLNNLAGNKMDYYLERDIEYVADGCDGDMRNSTITVRLVNTATEKQLSGLPEYVAGSGGIEATLPIKVPSGTMVTSVRVLATKGAKLMSVTSNGKRTSAATQVERGHPSFEVQLIIPPGKSGELEFRLSEPTSPGAPQVPVQPLIDGVTPKVSVPECSD